MFEEFLSTFQVISLMLTCWPSDASVIPEKVILSVFYVNRSWYIHKGVINEDAV
jgi:hypothetical protein